ncbi:MAG TPA: metallophosphatase domain-containing protein [Parachlamydiaceae bacterium]|nr:metallophosphatase domain-containing protein [Parachlamydiaceae bacterium]
MLKIDCISDTHGQHSKLGLPGGNILIHAGDFSPPDTEVEDVLAFLDWFQSQKYACHILVAGNHDGFFDLIPEAMEEECRKRGIFLLNDSGAEVEKIKIWGSPVQPGPSDWPFSRNRGKDIKRHWDLIPENTEILITHGPPYQIRDEIHPGEHVGCKELYDRILQAKIKLHVFGHVHLGAGYLYQDNCLYVNASSGFTRVIIKNGCYKIYDHLS